ncbi:hypothetical protein K488DRAFT_85068 [Vararia minispora EC-137]|uniref:Uncharacterized protein n=1 Tax=Vararia minispora EC-137 TaxID=1314806 RepID=A0ACB8QNQ8_9AGAM|nr:hypothetical protein K488DRAFT_85068 [Vararia minispora EC-137]
MRLAYTTHDTDNTFLVDGHGRQLYQITTDAWRGETKIFKLTGKVSALDIPVAAFKPLRKGSAAIEWSDGQWSEVGDWIESKGGLFFPSRSFTAASGQRYTWRTDGSHWILENEYGTHITRSHNRSLGIVGKKTHKAYLDINDKVSEDLDDIVISYTYLKKQQCHGMGRVGAYLHSFKVARLCDGSKVMNKLTPKDASTTRLNSIPWMPVMPNMPVFGFLSFSGHIAVL